MNKILIKVALRTRDIYQSINFTIYSFKTIISFNSQRVCMKPYVLCIQWIIIIQLHRYNIFLRFINSTLT